MKRTVFPEIWTTAQRGVLIALLLLLLLVLSIQAWRRPAFAPEPQAVKSLRGDEIADRLDPNTADAASLAAIPNIGEKRARDIIDYRKTFVAEHPGSPAFRSASDLMHVKGIGGATANNVTPFLMFPTQHP